MWINFGIVCSTFFIERLVTVAVSTFILSILPQLYRYSEPRLYSALQMYTRCNIACAWNPTSVRALFRRAQQQLRTMTTHPDCKDDEDFFRFTSGRWLWEEDSRLAERYRKFNVPTLLHIANISTGASCCISMNKLAEGGSNKIFRLVMNNEQSVIARIPYRGTASSSKTVASEVATMDFVSTLYMWLN